MLAAEVPMNRVLVVEDDATVASALVRGLRKAGFEVELETDGARGLKTASRGDHDAIVLDLMLPERDGFEVLEAIGARGVPIVVLSARDGLDDRLRAFGLGAVDFVAKPFWMEELVARLRTRLHVPEARPKRTVSWANVAIDLDGRTVHVGDAPVHLTRAELDVLVFLVERPGRAVPRDELLARLLDESADARTVDSHVARVRKKLGTAAAAIATVWGIGYRFDPDRAEGGGSGA
ncbi:MAG: response regulator transcription factor [Sandaracinus sp.]|nr:response regulator transcription factor [Myxococcales bacterium]MCB9612728.1 response regulator transcription factor [Sandaracinus sp.]